MSSTSIAQPARTVPEETRERVLRGLVLHADHADEITPLGHGRYEVPGCDGGTYIVDLDVFSDDPRETCSCPDHKRHPELSCKHITAATIDRAKARMAAKREGRVKFDAEAVAGNLDRMGA